MDSFVNAVPYIQTECEMKRARELLSQPYTKRAHEQLADRMCRARKHEDLEKLFVKLAENHPLSLPLLSQITLALLVTQRRNSCRVTFPFEHLSSKTNKWQSVRLETASLVICGK